MPKKEKSNKITVDQQLKWARKIRRDEEIKNRSRKPQIAHKTAIKDQEEELSNNLTLDEIAQAIEEDLDDE